MWGTKIEMIFKNQLYIASVEDEKALASQSTESRWSAFDARQIAEETIAHFLYPAQRSAPLLAFLFVGVLVYRTSLASLCGL
jgi:hypothetical protein